MFEKYLQDFNATKKRKSDDDDDVNKLWNERRQFLQALNAEQIKNRRLGNENNRLKADCVCFQAEIAHLQAEIAHLQAEIARLEALTHNVLPTFDENAFNGFDAAFVHDSSL